MHRRYLLRGRRSINHCSSSLVALLLGIVIGVLWPDFATSLKVLTTAFSN
jgi:Na+/H+-dicarboxylate symporter